MRIATLCALVLAAGCARERWPDPPPVDPSQYQQDYAAWRAERQQTIAFALPIVGIWPLEEGETTVRNVVFRRTGLDVVAVPKTGSPTPVTFEQPATLDTVRYELTGAPDGRVWIMATDETHPAIANPPSAETYPLDPRWRVAARFDAFEMPRPMRVPDVRGGTMEFMAVGQLVFRVGDEESRLTAIDAGDSLGVFFRDPTNRTTTYQGYRIVSAKKVAPGAFTILDFNLAHNPPCAFSPYTVCPLPPPENTLTVAIEAGEKRLPSARGYEPKS